MRRTAERESLQHCRLYKTTSLSALLNFHITFACSSLLLRPTRQTAQEGREREGRWYGGDKKGYICSLSRLCLMDGFCVQWKVDVMTDVWRQGEIVFAELFFRVCVTHIVNHSHRMSYRSVKLGEYYIISYLKQ